MADTRHQQKARSGVTAFNDWRQNNPHGSVDLSGTNLEDVDLDGFNFARVNLRGSHLKGRTLRNVDFTDADLTETQMSGCDLTSAKFSAGTILHSTKLQSAKFSAETLAEVANLKGVVFEGCQLAGLNFAAKDLAACNFNHCNLTATNFSKAALREARFENATLTRTSFVGANLHQASFSDAKLVEVDLTRAELHRARLAGSTWLKVRIRDADFTEADLSRASMVEVIDAHRARGLEHTKVDHALRYFDSARRGAIDRYCDWEKLRTVGKLPLFGASYAALVLIPISFYLLDIYNQHIVATVRAWGMALETSTDDRLSQLAPSFLAHIHQLPIPSQSLLLLVATILLALASTIYVLGCPARIKEFSREQWCHELRHELVHYWPFAWRHRFWRVVCGVSYVIGGTLVLWILATKLWRAGAFIVRNMEPRWFW